MALPRAELKATYLPSDDHTGVGPKTEKSLDAAGDVQRPDLPVSALRRPAIGDARSVLRKRHVLVVARFSGSPQIVTLPVEPCEFSARPGSAVISQYAVERNREECPRDTSHHLLDDRRRFAGHLEPPLVERLRHQRFFAQKKQVRRRAVMRRRISEAEIRGLNALQALLLRLHVDRADVNADVLRPPRAS